MTEQDLEQWLAMTGLTASSGGLGLCSGCATLDRCQLGLTHERLIAPDRATFAMACPVEREGSRGVAHGGWIADIFDEVLGRLLVLTDRFAVTGELRVAFHRPVRIARPLEITVQEVESPDHRLRVTGEMRMQGSDLVLASAEAHFVPRDREAHLERFEQWFADTTSASGLDGPPIIS